MWQFGGRQGQIGAWQCLNDFFILEFIDVVDSVSKCYKTLIVFAMYPRVKILQRFPDVLVLQTCFCLLRRRIHDVLIFSFKFYEKILQINNAYLKKCCIARRQIFPKIRSSGRGTGM
jgi:hypothetical protein